MGDVSLCLSIGVGTLMSLPEAGVAVSMVHGGGGDCVGNARRL